MKQRWLQLAARIDALSQRERVLVFAAVLAVLAAIGQFALIGPIQRRHDLLKSQIVQQRASLDETEAAIARKVAEAQADPDAAARKQLAALRADTARMNEQLLVMQHGLVPPERMAPLLESILRANGRLKLVSMQTLPVGSLNDIGAEGASAGPARTAAADTGTEAAKQGDLLFRHGVELTVRGSYLDMVDYMSALEALPTQLFWGKAQLEVEQYPTVRLTLTLYTLSLDEKWMKL
ncbi:MAG: type II secretion system protein GspM [Telluria sp.]